MECVQTQQRKPPTPPCETLSHESFYPTESAAPSSTERPPSLTPLSSSTSETPHSHQYMMMPYPMMPPPAVQLKGIVHPHPHDVLCGRGGQSNIHPGNAQWRLLVAANKELYVTLPKKQKMMLSQSIVNAVRSQVPSGRFLQKDMHNDLWYDVGDKRAQEKTSQALREGAPEIRDKLKAHDAAEGSTATPEPIPSAKTVEETKEGPPSLDHSPSQEQMPPPQTIPERKTAEAKPPPKEGTPPQSAVSCEPVPYHHPSPADYFTDAPAVVEPIPLPQPFVEAHATCSFGSIGLLSDIEQAQLMNSFFSKNDESNGTPVVYHQGYPPPPAYYQHPSAYPPTSSYPSPMDPNYHYYPNSNHHHNNTASTYAPPPDARNYPPPTQYDPVPQPVDHGLEPVGLSIGSMMSMGTMGPPEAGLSIGSAMSYTTLHMRRGSRIAPPDGGLQDVGMSLGSLSLADGDRERIIAEAERDIAALMRGSDNTMPTLLHQQKSKGNLLECSDSEDDDEDGTSAEASAQRSHEQWNRMQATLAEQDESIRNNMRMPTTVELTQHRPPVTGQWFPASLDRDFSQMSAISVGEDFEPSSYPERTLRFSDGIPPGTVLQFDEKAPASGVVQMPQSER